MTFDEALSHWSVAATRRDADTRPISARTREQYATNLRALNRLVGPLTDPPNKLMPRLTAWRDQVANDYRRGRCSAMKIRSYVSALRSFYAVFPKEYPQNPGTLLKSVSKDPREPRPVSDDNIDRLFGVLDASTPRGLRDRAMIWLYYSSIRNSEVATLTTANVAYDPTEQTLVLRFRGKGDKFRTVVLRTEAALALSEHLLEQFAPDTRQAWVDEQIEELAASVPDPEARAAAAVLLTVDSLLARVLKDDPRPVFLHNGKPMTRRESNRIFAAYRTKAGLPSDIGPHALRHTFATGLLNNDEDLRTVQEILGHARIQQTAQYIQVLTSKKGRAVRKLRVPSTAKSVPSWA